MKKPTSSYERVRLSDGFRDILACQDKAHGSVTARRHLKWSKWLDYRLLSQNLFQRNRLTELSYRIECRVTTVLNRHRSQLCTGDAILMHVSRGIHRVP